LEVEGGLPTDSRERLTRFAFTPAFCQQTK